jgi:AcrR family transcriptional regulator
MANKQPEVTARTRNALMDAFWEVYSAAPDERVTAQAVVRRAGLNRSTFYEYFTCADEVLEAWEDRLIAAVEEMAAMRLRAGLAGDLTSEAAGLYESHSERVVVLLGRHGNARFARRLRDTLLPPLREALGLDEADPLAGYVAEFSMAGQIAVLTRWHESGRRIPLTDLIAMMQRMITGALRSFAAGRQDPLRPAP